MTRFAIDADTAIALVLRGDDIPARHSLVAPGRMRSDALGIIHRRMREHQLDAVAARRVLEGIATQRVRLLSDRVSRALALQLADRLDLADTRPAEYLAVAKLQADALITADETLRLLAGGLVPLAEVEDVVR